MGHSGQSGESWIAKFICAHQFLQARQIGIPCQPFPGKVDETYSLYQSSKKDAHAIKWTQNEKKSKVPSTQTLICGWQCLTIKLVIDSSSTSELVTE